MKRGKSSTWRAVLSLACVTLALPGCGKKLNDSECEALLDHYVELLLRDDRPKSSAAEVLRLKQEARQKAARDPAFLECSQRVSRKSFDCAMSADDANRLEQCLL